MMRRIMITGAKGFVGAYLRSALAARHPAATVISLAAADEAEPGFVAADLLDRDALDAAVTEAAPDAVVHLAAQSSVARTAQDADATFAVNLGGSLNLASAIARHAPNATLLFASSSEVYGASFLGGRVTETSPTLPMNAYAKSKRLAEEMFAAVLPAGATLVVARPFNHTGAGQRENFVLPSFAGQVARIEAGRQPARLMVGNIDVRRDFLDVRDVVEAYLALLEAAPRLPSRFTCNVASGDARPIRDLIDTLRGLSQTPFEVEVDPLRLRPVDLPVAAGDASLLRAVTGWAPRIALADTLSDLLSAARSTVAHSG